jgi:NADPH2:quinone reductase
MWSWRRSRCCDSAVPRSSRREPARSRWLVRGRRSSAVEVADVLTLDAALRAGDGTDFFDLRPPYVPGGGIAGRVLATGHAEDAGWIGRRVVARLGQHGACAERAVAPVETLVEIPDGLGSVDAAALVHDGLTARGLLEAAAVRPGERVLVTGRRRSDGGAARAGPAAGGRDGGGRDPRAGQALEIVRTSARRRSTTAMTGGTRRPSRPPPGPSTSSWTGSAARSAARRSRFWPTEDGSRPTGHRAAPSPRSTTRRRRPAASPCAASATSGSPRTRPGG